MGNEQSDFRIKQLQLEQDNLEFQIEKEKREAELIIANKELDFQNKEKENRAAELIIANKELLFQNGEKEKRAAELLTSNNDLAIQSREIEQKTKELLLAREQIDMAGVIISRAWRYNQSLIEASIDPIITIDEMGMIIDVNTAVENGTGLSKNKLIGTSFSEIFSDPEKARSYYQTVFEKGQSFNYELNLKHTNGFTTPVIYNAFVYSDNEEKRVGVMVADNDITTKQKDEIVYLQINLNLLIKQRTKELMIANEKLAIENEKNEYLGYHDYLTGLYNRRYFENELKRLDTKTNFPISIIMCDVDGLKLINDSFGHSSGDELLKKAAGAINKACRTEDVVSRLGGDEFAVILPRTDAGETVLIANQIKDFASQGKVEKIELSISYGYDTKKTEDQSLIEVFATAENHMYRHKLYERSSMRSSTIDLIMNTLFEKSNRKSLHSNRVSSICQAIALKINFDSVYIKKMRIAGLVHDIGKIGIDNKILNKAGKLSSDEWNDMKRHSEIGWRILSTTNEFLELAQFVLNHHERWDGSGYPNGLKGESIPLESRIIAVADACDAMTSERSYRKGRGKEESIKELIR
ncbi:diguanylate cyclase [Gudongella sp. DL1XJH-153]|uniref:diguanylate cyclase n=1 Tax=Gudongella sp. DL1XJH-153 TaxID=3409804 RepID=UPI003BB6ED02